MAGVGTFRHSILIEQLVRTPDGQGGNTSAWTTFKSLKARIDPLRARQIDFGQKLEHRVTHRICMRFFTGLTSEMRVNFGGRIFHIQGIRNPQERNRFYEVDAREGAAS